VTLSAYRRGEGPGRERSCCRA